MSSYQSNRPPWQDPQVRAWWQQWRRSVIAGGVGIALFGLMWGSYYQIEPEEVGVVLRFGAHVDTAAPGPHFKLPLGIDTVYKVPVQRQLKMELGFRTLRADVRTEYARPQVAASEAKMLTGDLNVGIVRWVVQYKVANPEQYLFRFRHIDSTLRLMAEATMRTVVGDHSVDELITAGREVIGREAKDALSELNERYDPGIVIQQLKLKEVNVADPVKPALREVEEAKQERERVINEAWAAYNKVIPQAEGKALQVVQAAKGYAVERTNRATGDADRFSALYNEYKKAPKVTRTRLYLETLGEILPKAKHKVIMDAKTQGLVPLLSLQKGAP